MNGLAISGASTKLTFSSGISVKLAQSKNYDIITGISAGSIISLLLAIGEYDLLKEAVTNSTESDFFKTAPLNNNGNITLGAILRVVSGKESLGDFTLGDLLRRYYTSDMHDKMMKCGKIVKVGATNMNLNRIEYQDITKVDYDTALLWVVASSSIPVATQMIKIGNYYYADGGVIQNVGGMEAISSGATSLDVVFSRPEKTEPSVNDYNWKPTNIISVVTRVLDSIADTNSFNDEEEITLECQNKNIPLKMYYPPYELTYSLYKIDTDLSKSWYQLGLDTTI